MSYNCCGYNSCSPYQFCITPCSTTSSCNPYQCYTPCPPKQCCPPVLTNQNVVYITTITTFLLLIPTNGVDAPPLPIPIGSTSIPAGTVNVITGFNSVPITNIGGITLNNSTGQFSVPVAGNYTISATVSFTASSAGSREVYIYKVDQASGIISLVAMDGRNATTIGPTYVNVSGSYNFNAGDLIFFAATQNSGLGLSISLVNKFEIVKV